MLRHYNPVATLQCCMCCKVNHVSSSIPNEKLEYVLGSKACGCRAVVLDFRVDREVGQTAQSCGVSQPPPNKRPGPSEARKIGRRSWRAFFEALRKASCRAAPHVDEPRLPDTWATGGK